MVCRRSNLSQTTTHCFEFFLKIKYKLRVTNLDFKTLITDTEFMQNNSNRICIAISLKQEHIENTLICLFQNKGGRRSKTEENIYLNIRNILAAKLTAKFVNTHLNDETGKLSFYCNGKSSKHYSINSILNKLDMKYKTL